MRFLTLVLLAKVHLQFKGTGSRDFIPLFLGEIILFQRSKCACPRCQRLHRQRVCGVNDYIDNVSAESTTTRTHNVCTQFKLSFVPFIICFFSTYKTYPPCTCSQLLPWHLVSKKWTTTWTNNFCEFLRGLKSFVKPICQFILIKKG